MNKQEKLTAATALALQGELTTIEELEITEKQRINENKLTKLYEVYEQAEDIEGFLDLILQVIADEEVEKLMKSGEEEYGMLIIDGTY